MTALVSRIRCVRAAAAASTTAGAETTKSGRWCSPTPKTSRPDLVGELDLLDAARASAAPAPSLLELGERVDAESPRDAVSPKRVLPGGMPDYGQNVGDGRTFDQAIRALDKFVAERVQAPGNIPDPNSPVRRAYERIVRGADTQVDAA